MRTLPVAIVLLGLPWAAQAGPLNDTGVDFCRDLATWVDTKVAAPNTCAPLPTHGAQDARYGRDAAASAGVLRKVGGGRGGFDFSKVANNGSVLPASASQGSNPTDWACTYDNNTGLLWEVKSLLWEGNTRGLRGIGHTYTWYNTALNYLETAGTSSGGTCETTGRCDTEKFIADVNAIGLCGHKDWRLPTLRELENLADLGVDPGGQFRAIDSTYFPDVSFVSFPLLNPAGRDFWSATPSPDASDGALSWYVDFSYGSPAKSRRSRELQVRLVRTGL